MKVLIDGDVLQYWTAFAAQKTRYTFEGQEFEDAEAAKLHCTEAGLDYRQLRKDGAITSHLEVMPESACKMILKQKLDGILNATDATDHEILLSGRDNFRFRIAKTKGYKANRDDVPKPVHHEAVRALLLSWGAEVVEGIEADDAMGIAMRERSNRVAIATIDKDLNQIPGLHYDWNKGLKYNVSPNDALWFFHRQMLMGDTTDNIPGIPGYGEKKAGLAMDPYRRCTPLEGWSKVREVYLTGPFEFKDGTKTPDDLDAYLAEQGGLLWILRQADEEWTPSYHERTYV